MAISFVAESLTSGQNTGAVSAVVSVPTGTADDDVMIAYGFAINGSASVPTITVPSGWTTIDEDDDVSEGGATKFKVGMYYRVASSEPSNYTWTYPLDTGTQRIVFQIATFRGVDTTTPLDDAAADGDVLAPDLDDLTPPANDKTVNTVGSWAVTFAGLSDNEITSFVAPSGFTMIPDSNIQFQRNLGGAYKEFSSTGSTSIGDWANTGTFTDCQYVVGTCVLKAPSTAGGALPLINGGLIG